MQPVPEPELRAFERVPSLLLRPRFKDALCKPLEIVHAVLTDVGSGVARESGWRERRAVRLDLRTPRSRNPRYHPGARRGGAARECAAITVALT